VTGYEDDKFDMFVINLFSVILSFPVVLMFVFQ
jgi:hypothetical protein